ncbi:NAD(P)H-dependent glycerol-3-phosphate dehydrogenase [Mycoplasmopsis pullorum]|uniref:Glycerol-3-phosphate dehydrogenase n=1 Tax=Mycoplasmopsis pullorum TaxID=48003 RepID=A0A1L4FS80_9BACT|nr:NAD(P)H-dependent glycerol-3-phosphate dehydrogenase [Mycoplasmopsis pullorum]APJ38439.1 glycerol-3-phosphate dehydrogenase [Mycoplasmopsis pullorum]
MKNKIKKITFIGTGAWASALATVVLRNNYQVSMYGINEKEIEDINQGYNRKYFGNKMFNNRQNLTATNSLEEALKDTDLIVLAVPSEFIKDTLKAISQVLKYKKVNLVNVAKGIENNSKKFFSEFIEWKFGKNLKNLATLIGPSFAQEVFEENLTMINVVGKNEEYLQLLLHVFNNPYFRLVINKNEKGSELFAALKNVLAIGIGIMTYKHPEKNPQSALLSVGVKEIYQIYKFLNPDSKDDIGFELAGIGDIFLTCSSTKSRNFSFGLHIAELGLKPALEQENKTIEGYNTAKILDKIIKENDLNVPFLKSIIDVLFYNKSPLMLLDFVNEYN